jgi:hypothetical protein
MSKAKNLLWMAAMIGACGHPATPTAPAGLGKETSPSLATPAAQPNTVHERSPEAKTDEPSAAWERGLNESTRKTVRDSLGWMWNGAMAFYEASDGYVGPGSETRPKRFPGDERSHWTLDCCKPSLDCNDHPRWKDQDPWIKLNFGPREYDQHLRFDLRSTGTEKAAHFLAVVSVDPKCDGHPIYVWRRGSVDENGDVIGRTHLEAGDRPPELEHPSSH